MVLSEMPVLLPAQITAYRPLTHSPILRWHLDSDRLEALTAWTIPPEICPEPECPWLPQLAPKVQQPLLALREQHVGGFIICEAARQRWLLECIPDGPDRFLILAHDLQLPIATSGILGLHALECDRPKPAGPSSEHNRALLQQLYQASGCDRLIIWEFAREQMHPRYVMGESQLPQSQAVDTRYLKALRARGTLGFSEVRHQPTLATQRYLLQDGILARLDALILRNQQSYGVLTLEYRSWQQRFEEGLFVLASKVAERLMQPLPDGVGPFQLVDPWVMAQWEKLQQQPNLAGLQALQTAFLHDWQTELTLWMPSDIPGEWVNGLNQPTDSVTSWQMTSLERRQLAGLSRLIASSELSHFAPLRQNDANDSAVWLWPLQDDERQLCALLALRGRLAPTLIEQMWRCLGPQVLTALPRRPPLRQASWAQWLPPVVELDRYLDVCYASPALIQLCDGEPWRDRHCRWWSLELTTGELRKLLRTHLSCVDGALKLTRGPLAVRLHIQPERRHGRLHRWHVRVEPLAPQD